MVAHKSSLALKKTEEAVQTEERVPLSLKNSFMTAHKSSLALEKPEVAVKTEKRVLGIQVGEIIILLMLQ